MAIEKPSLSLNKSPPPQKNKIKIKYTRNTNKHRGFWSRIQNLKKNQPKT